MENKEALNTLNEIKDLMERSSRFKAVSGWSIVIIGILASLASAVIYYFFNEMVLNTPLKLKIALVVAVCLFVVSSLTVLLMSRRKALKNGVGFKWDATISRLVLNFTLPMLAGGIFCVALVMHGYYGLTSSVMLLFYGMALLCSQKYTYSSLRFLAYAELILGLIDCFVVDYALLIWFVGFGILHIVYGIVFIVRHKEEK